MLARRSLAWPYALAIASIAFGPSARAQSQVDACIAAGESGQRLRDEGKLLAAKERFTRCATGTCPRLIQADCARWLDDLMGAIPTVVFSARDASGNDLRDVSVRVDGTLVTTILDGREFPIDPGQHVVVMEPQSAARKATTKTFIVNRGEKHRVLAMTFPLELDARESPAPSASSGGGPPAASWILGGLGVVALGSFAYFGVTGLSARSDLEHASCAPTRTCAQSDLDAVRTKFLVADVSLGVGVVSLALATWLWLRNTDAAPRARAAAGIAF